MPEPRMNLNQRDSWPDFNPLNFDCDVEGCDAKKGEYCDQERQGIHIDRALDELLKVVAERKRRHQCERS